MVNNSYVPEKALVVKKIVSEDTKENRFTKFMLIKSIKKIDAFIIKYDKNNLLIFVMIIIKGNWK